MMDSPRGYGNGVQSDQWKWVKRYQEIMKILGPLPIPAIGWLVTRSVPKSRFLEPSLAEGFLTPSMGCSHGGPSLEPRLELKFFGTKIKASAPTRGISGLVVSARWDTVVKPEKFTEIVYSFEPPSYPIRDTDL